MRYWMSCTFLPTDELVDIARAAEQYGFEGLCFGEHMVVPEQIDSTYPYSESGNGKIKPSEAFPDPLVLIAHLAAVTERLRFATTVYVLPIRELLAVAKAVATTAYLSRNRLVFGLGMGWLREEFEAVGANFEDRGRRGDEMIDALRLLLGGGVVEYHGKYVDFPRLEVSPAPTAPVPMLIGGHTPVALRRAARLDGWIGIPQTDAEMDHLLTDLAARQGPTPDPDYINMVSAVVPPDRATARAYAAHGVTDLTINWREVVGSRRASLTDKIAGIARISEELAMLDPEAGAESPRAT